MREHDWWPRGRGWLAAIATVGLAACGGGGSGSTAGGDPGASGVQVATFIDSPVSGLQVSSAGVSRLTDDRGNFEYRAGETVTFSVGSLVLGSTVPKGDIVRPTDLVAGARDSSDPRVTRILRTLQSLDDNADPEDGIRISAGTREYLRSRSSSTVRLDDEDTSDEDVARYLPAGTFTVSEEDARQHYARHDDDESNAGQGYTDPTAGGPVAQPASSAGRLLASNCFQCHGTGGMGGFERIRGGEAAEVREYLGRNPADSIMAAHAQGFTRAQLDSIVAYLNQ